MRGTGPDWLDVDEGYSFLVLAAVEARRASRRYWAAVDRQYPVARDMDRIWPLGAGPLAEGSGPPRPAATRRGKPWK